MSAAAPIVIAHRGASGYLPEHSIEAKMLAYGLGADYLEQDVIATRDGELVVLHDLYLDDVSDVRDRYPGRARADGRCYAIDFELAELETLSFRERRKPRSGSLVYPSRFSAPEVGFGIVSLRRELSLIGELNRETGRKVGIYPEIKDPQWHREQGFDLATALLGTLREFGYERAEHAAFVQCFDPAELERVRTDLGSELRLVQLVDDGEPQREMLSRDGLARIAGYAQVVAPHYLSLVDVSTGQARAAAAVARIAAAGLLLHPYTFRRDALPEALDLDFDDLLAFFFREIRVDGVFTDHPDLALGARRAALGTP